jgi:hypothetical protein
MIAAHRPTSHSSAVADALTAALLALALGACSPDAPVAPTRVRSTSLVAATVPFKGSCVTTSSAQPLGPGRLRILVLGACHFSQLGLTQFSADQIADFGAGTLSGSNVFVAANGDELYSVNSGSLAPPVAGSLATGGDVTFTGGTGRFTHASGYGHFAGTVDVAAQTGVNEWEGALRYDASDRSSSP